MFKPEYPTPTDDNSATPKDGRPYLQASPEDSVSNQSEKPYGAANRLRAGGCIWLRLQGQDRRTIRNNFNRIAWNKGGMVIYDSDSSRDKPSKESLMSILQSLGEDELVIALGSNPNTFSNELMALVLRHDSDVNYLLTEIHPKLVVKAPFSSFQRMISLADILAQ